MTIWTIGLGLLAWAAAALLIGLLIAAVIRRRDREGR